MPQRYRIPLLAIAAAVALLATAQPASAQQVIDASKDGDLAFIAFAGMCFLFVALLFLIDHVRRRGQ